MVASASSTAHPSNVSFAKGSDSDLSAVDGQIDLVLGAQTAHWWNIPTFLPLIRAKAAPKCTIALCGYTLVNSRTHPRITELVRETAYGDSKLGPFWEAGREELEDGYPNIEKQLREGGVSNIQRIEFLGKRIIQSGPGFPADAKPFVELDMTLAAFKNYLGTWSSYNTWKQQHPKLAGTEDDHIVSLINQVRAELGAQGQNDEDIKVELDWPHFLICGEI